VKPHVYLVNRQNSPAHPEANRRSEQQQGVFTLPLGSPFHVGQEQKAYLEQRLNKAHGFTEQYIYIFF